MTKLEKMRITVEVAEAVQNAVQTAFVNHIHNHDWEGETLWSSDDTGSRYDYDYLVSRLTPDGLAIKLVFDKLGDKLVDAL